MATITLDYNAQNMQARKALDYILSLGVFKTKERIAKIEPVSRKRKKIDKIFDPYLIDLSNFKFDRDEANNYD